MELARVVDLALCDVDLVQVLVLDVELGCFYNRYLYTALISFGLAMRRILPLLACASWPLSASIRLMSAF